jgi:hypothetical protein
MTTLRLSASDRAFLHTAHIADDEPELRIDLSAAGELQFEALALAIRERDEAQQQVTFWRAVAVCGAALAAAVVSMAVWCVK